MSCEKCERDIERLRSELNVLRREMIEVVGGMLARVDEVLAEVKTCNRQMFADLQQIDPLARDRELGIGEAGDVSAGLCQVRYQTLFDRIGDAYKNNRNGFGGLLQGN